MAAGSTLEFVCPACGWEGTQPTLDAHLNPFCPQCGGPAQFKAVWDKYREGEP